MKIRRILLTALGGMAIALFLPAANASAAATPSCPHEGTLAVVKTVDSASHNLGDKLVWTITVTAGPCRVDDVVVSDTGPTPVGLVLVSSTLPAHPFDLSANSFTTFTLTDLAVATGTFTNTAAAMGQAVGLDCPVEDTAKTYGGPSPTPSFGPSPPTVCRKYVSGKGSAMVTVAVPQGPPGPPGPSGPPGPTGAPGSSTTTSSSTGLPNTGAE